MTPRVAVIECRSAVSVALHEAVEAATVTSRCDQVLPEFEAGVRVPFSWTASCRAAKRITGNAERVASVKLFEYIGDGEPRE